MSQVRLWTDGIGRSGGSHNRQNLAANGPAPRLPSGWTWVALAELASNADNAITDGPFGSNLKTQHYTKCGPRVIRLQNIGDGVFVNAEAHIAEEHYRSLLKHKIEAGDIAIATLGEQLPRACVIPASVGPAIVKADCIRFQPHSELALAAFVSHMLNAPQTRARAAAIIHGVGRPRLNLGEIRTLHLPLPPLSEQRRIVAEIEKHFTRLEAAVDSLKRAQANLKRYRAAVLKAACEGRLVPTEAELARAEGREYEPGTQLLGRILEERRVRLHVQGSRQPAIQEPAYPQSSSLPRLTEGWTWSTLEQLLIFLKNGIGIKPAAEDGLPILRISAVRPRSVDMTDIRYLGGDQEAYSRYLLEPGDLLFTRYNGNAALVGVCGLVRTVPRPTAHPDKLIRVKVLSDLSLPNFLEIVLNAGASREFLSRRVRTTAGQAGVSGADLRAIPVPLPPVAEQQRIADEVERRLSVIDELGAAVAANLTRADRLRQAILKRAFAGKLVPQDPDDVPASLLLERIRAERARAEPRRRDGRARQPRLL